MVIFDIIERRRSIRRFLNKPVEREKIQSCLAAARLAPSACNAQPWKFVVVDDPEVKTKVGEAAFSGVYAMNAFAKKAPVIIVVVSEKGKFLSRAGGQFRGTPYYLIDVGIATEHLVLQAEELGLGTCWIGWFNEKAVKPVLNIPKDRKVDILIAMGYHDMERRTSEHNRVDMDKMASFNSYWS